MIQAVFDKNGGYVYIQDDKLHAGELYEYYRTNISTGEEVLCSALFLDDNAYKGCIDYWNFIGKNNWKYEPVEGGGVVEESVLPLVQEQSWADLRKQNAALVARIAELEKLSYIPREQAEVLIAELRELRKRTCAICGDSGKLDDAQAWDEGQEPSDCPYCPERLDELRAQNARLRAENARLRAALERIRWLANLALVAHQDALASVRGDA